MGVALGDLYVSARQAAVCPPETRHARADVLKQQGHFYDMNCCAFSLDGA
jgi:hypothetical protein